MASALDPPGSLASILAGRLPTDAVVGPLRESLIAASDARLVSVGEPPDIPHPALSRVLTGQSSPIDVVTIPRRGDWLASIDGAAIRVWDLAAATLRHVLRGGRLLVRPLPPIPRGRGWPRAATTTGCGSGTRPLARCVTS